MKENSSVTSSVTKQSNDNGITVEGIQQKEPGGYTLLNTSEAKLVEEGVETSNDVQEPDGKF